MSEDEPYKPTPVNPEFEILNVEDRTGKKVDMECLVVVLEGQDYEICWETTISSSSKTDGYGRSSPYKGKLEKYQGADMKAVHGFFGEVALAKAFSLTVDTSYRTLGDDYDFIFDGLKTDMKLVMPASRRRPSITAQRYGRATPDKELYIMGFVVDHREDEYAKIAIVGYMGGDEVTSRQLRKSNHPDTLNYDVYFTDTHSMRDFL